MRYRLIRAAVGAVAIAVVVLGLNAPASAAETSKVFVVHGIPGQPVDVYVNGAKILTNFQPTKIAGPLNLAAGSYDVVLTKPGGNPASSPLLRVDNAAIPGGKNLSLVAHLTAGGTPTLTPFINDTSRVAAGNARLIVRHTAAAPAVDVRADGTPVFRGLTNPNEAKVDVAAGTISADVVLAGTTNVVIGPVDVNLAEGTATIVYAIGSAQDKTLTITSQVITGLQTGPGGVSAGSGGLADPSLPAWWYATAGVGALLLLGGIAATIRRAKVAPQR
jgi:hypothetical protein